MRVFISKILILALILSAFPFLTACTDSKDDETKTEKLTYYVTDDSYGRFKTFAERYNRYCYDAYENDPSYQIEFVKFESEEELYAKLSTELMAGKGPDLVSLEQKLPFEKLMKQNVFMNIYDLLENNSTDDEVDWTEYNQTILDACSYDGNLYILPVAFGNDVLIADRSILERYDVTAKPGSTLTYGNLSDDFSHYFSASDKAPFLSNGTAENIFYNFIFNYVDFANEEVYFDTPEFESALDDVLKIMETVEDAYDFDIGSNSLFEGTGFSFTATAWTYGTQNSFEIFNGLSKDEDDYNAYIQIGFAINKNSKKTDQLLSLINYSLGELVQEFYSDAWEFQMNSGGSSHPVRYEAFENSIINSGQLKYYDGGLVDVDNDFMQTYVDITKKANTVCLYEIKSESYYAKDVIGSIVSNYLIGDITKAKFIRQLTSATKIYLDE